MQGGLHWTYQNRDRYNRDHLRYQSDQTDAESELIAPRSPAAKHGGHPRKVDECEIVNGVLYILSTGCQWRALSKDLPPRSTVHDYLKRRLWDGTVDRIYHEPYV